MKEVRQDIPDELLVCLTPAPAPQGIVLGSKDGLLILDDEAASAWLGAVIVAGKDCRAKLAQVRALVKR